MIPVSKIRSLFLLAATLAFFPLAAAVPGTNPVLDSLLKVAVTMAPDTNKVMHLNRVAFEYSAVSPYDGIQYGIEALTLAERLRFDRGMARANSVLGANYFSLSDFPNAYKYWLESLQINERIGFMPGVANHLHNIGMVFFSQKDFDKALDYYQRALEVSEKIGDSGFITNSYTAIGRVYAEKKDFSRSLENHLKALALDKASGNEKAISTDMVDIGAVYAAMGDRDRAMEMFRSAIDIKRRIGDNNGLAKACFLVGKLYFDRNEFLLARSYLDSAEQVSRKFGFLDNLRSAAEYQARTLEALGDHQGALASYKEFASIRDSIYSTSRQKEIFNLEKKAEIAEEKRLQELEAREKQRVKYIQMAGISLFILALVGGVLLLSRKRIRAGWFEILSTLSVIVLFEFIQLLVHGTIERITHHDLLLTYLCLLAVAAVVVPLHHRVEHWMKRRVGSHQGGEADH